MIIFNITYLYEIKYYLIDPRGRRYYNNNMMMMNDDVVPRLPSVCIPFFTFFHARASRRADDEWTTENRARVRRVKITATKTMWRRRDRTCDGRALPCRRGAREYEPALCRPPTPACEAYTNIFNRVRGRGGGTYKTFSHIFITIFISYNHWVRFTTTTTRYYYNI